MASYTTNLNLKKPAGSENVAIGDINNNMDIIDNAIGTLNSKIKFGTWETVTLPYDVPGDGFVYVYFNPSSTSGGRTRLSYTQGSITNQITAVATDGNGVSAFAPVTKNAQITQQELSGGSITVRYLTCFG